MRWIKLGGQTVKNLLCLVCKFDLDQSERKSLQVNASTRNAWPNRVASSIDPSLFGQDFKSESNKGVAWRGVTLACNCSAVMFEKSSLTSLLAAGLPKPRAAFQSPTLLWGEKMDGSFPITLSTVPLVKCVGQSHGVFHLTPRNVQWGLWTAVRPSPSFQTRNFTISMRRAEEIF